VSALPERRDQRKGDLTSLTSSEKAELVRLERIVDRGLQSFVEVARALLEIRASRLYRQTHRTFEEYARDRFGLAPRTVYGYTEAVGVLENLNLPPEADPLTLSHLRALAPLPVEGQRELAPVVSEMTVAEARRVIKAWRAEQRAGRVLKPPPLLPEGSFRTVCADPPYRFNEKQGGYGDGLAEDKYESMATDEIAALPVADLAAPDSHLYLWTPATKVPDALLVCEAWGFRYVGLLTWVKPGSLGLGTWWRYGTEHVVFGVRGSLPTNPNLRNWFEAPRRRHSAKPDEFFDLVEKASPGPYLELFARRQRVGWTCWGNEVAPGEMSE
jgi:N6-adenosine-specific RNA methylase IME4